MNVVYRSGKCVGRDPKQEVSDRTEQVRERIAETLFNTRLIDAICFT